MTAPLAEERFWQLSYTELSSEKMYLIIVANWTDLSPWSGYQLPESVFVAAPAQQEMALCALEAARRG